MRRHHRLLLSVFGGIALLFICYVQYHSPYGLYQKSLKTAKENISSGFVWKSSDGVESFNIFKPLVQRVVRRKFEERGRCKPLYGKVSFFVMYRKESLAKAYAVAQESFHCYLKGTDYPVAMVDIDADKRVNKACGHHQQLFFKKHCAAAEFLKDGDWTVVLDADTGVVNPHHCIEEWIDPRVNIIFYERYFNWEIASGNYIARNTPFTYEFLKNWADWEFTQPSNWNGADNGVLQLLILQTVLPDAVQEIKNCDYYWRQGRDYDTYMAYVTCVKLALGATRLWPGKIRIYRRAHGWVRDGFLTSEKWGPSDFMLHGWKAQKVGDDGWESPFERNINVSECGIGDEGWPWIAKKRISDEGVRKELADFEKSTGENFPKKGRVIPHLRLPDVRNCYPNCEEETDKL